MSMKKYKLHKMLSSDKYKFQQRPSLDIDKPWQIPTLSYAQSIPKVDSLDSILSQFGSSNINDCDHVLTILQPIEDDCDDRFSKASRYSSESASSHCLSVKKSNSRKASQKHSRLVAKRNSVTSKANFPKK